MNPIAQLRHAAESKVALAMGGLLGAFVPSSTFVVVHCGKLITVRTDGTVSHSLWSHPGWWLVAGGLAFSATTVYRWAASAFRPSGGQLTWWESVYTRVKAAGFVLLVEGVLMFSPMTELSYVALGVLVVINALGTGAALALADRADRESGNDSLAEAELLVSPAESVPTLALRALPGPVSAPSNVGKRVDYYARALEVLRENSLVSAVLLRKRCVMTAPDASAMLDRLVAEGLVSSETNARGQRQVLIGRIGA